MNIKNKYFAIGAVFLTFSTIGIVHASSFKEVTLDVDGVKRVYSVRGNTTDEVLESMGIEVKDSDKIIGKEEIKDNDIIYLRTQKELIFNDKEVKTNALNIKELLIEQGYRFTDKDLINYTPDTKLTNNMNVRYYPYEEEIVKKERVLNHEEEVVYDFDKTVDFEEVSEGKDGLAIDTFKFVHFKGEVTKDLIKTDIKIPAKNKIITKGSKLIETVSIPRDIEYQYDNSLDKGYQETIREGNDGSKTVTYKVEGDDKTVVEENVTKDVVNKIVKVGTRETYITPQSNNYNYSSNVSGSESAAKEWIAQRESNGSYTAYNPGGGYYGRYQLNPSLVPYGASPAEQEAAADNYVAQRYGSWTNAQAFWQRNGWY